MFADSFSFETFKGTKWTAPYRLRLPENYSIEKKISGSTFLPCRRGARKRQYNAAFHWTSRGNAGSGQPVI